MPRSVLILFFTVVTSLLFIFTATYYFTDWKLVEYQNECRLAQYVNVSNQWDHYCLDPKHDVIISKYIR